MSQRYSDYLLSYRQKSLHVKSLGSSPNSASLDMGVKTVKCLKTTSMFEEAKERIAELLRKPKISASTYDTAWVAMVPSPHSAAEPCFPDCVNWLMENQCDDGSWAHPHHHHLLRKDVLSSTLACVLALKRWGVGEQHINKGVHFIESSITSATDESQISPLGFDIIFPGMLEYAEGLSLNLNLEPKALKDLYQTRDLKLERCYRSESVEMEASLGYFSEGIRNLQKWESVIKYQRRNGSIFNSPSTTAAAYIRLQNPGCLDYLQSALKKLGDAVPAVYPIDMHAQLCTIDNLERLGIFRHFRNEIQSVLDETYRCWQRGEEEIFMDASTCALAFRILRMNGYDVTSDPLTKILEEDCSSNPLSGHTRDANTALEVFKASEMTMYPTESALETQSLRLKHFLALKVADGLIHSGKLGRNIDKEVTHVLQYPYYAILPRMENRKSIEHYKLDNVRMLKTSYSSPNFGNMDFLYLSVSDFNTCQKMHLKELKEIERWVVESRLDELKFARSKSAYCYFSAAASIFLPELSDARISWAKNGVLTTIIDDFFDVGGSIEELKLLIQWDVEINTGSCSENVQIIFSALKGTICEIVDKAFIRQDRNVMHHVIGIWLDLLKSMLKETEWSMDNYKPSISEYMNNAYISFALGPIVLPALYLVGPKLSEEMVHHSEYHNLFKLMSTCGRLLNDIHSYERESKEGKINALSLYMYGSGRNITREDSTAEMKRLIDNSRRELLRLVLERKGGVLPRSCKNLFWHMSTVLHLFYIKDDGFTSQDLIKVVNSIIHEPIILSELKT
ncbi:ent-kaur-16-ene synthase, chloroplastic [Dorcoceras hygrometricum]|uniref:Ent-kaur-16-ene synthase, chloroplastic n=1 Tax=Dorcoceras hygrometricum TaxID=472368 RepID=A0A2Z7BVS2_9LAMI|nr:ent-kaur-16-ene synthase, chloroplastic [Dorcoceras hygrometricum]